jgi:hypothetical protein
MSIPSHKSDHVHFERLALVLSFVALRRSYAQHLNSLPRSARSNPGIC